MTSEKKGHYDVAVIGGGLTGLTAAVYLAKAGKSVILFEKEEQLGGLAQTTNVNGALFNLGPHAMYEGGAALRILEQLGCFPAGGYASKGSMLALYQGVMLEVPKALSNKEKLEWGHLMGGLNQINTLTLGELSVEDWAKTNIQFERVRLLFYAMCRQWSYCDNMGVLSAGYVIEQGKLAAQGVRYIEGGWQTIVNALRKKAVQFGAHVVLNQQINKVLQNNERVHAVQLSSGVEVSVTNVIATVGLKETCCLIEGAEQTALGRWREKSYPLYASCLDVALKQLPYPERVFALGLDVPLYYSKHSGPVQLSEDGAQVLHVMRYNDDQDERDAKKDEEELTRWLDLLEPGWKSLATAVRYSPNVLVANDAHTIYQQGKGIAPSPIVPEISGLFVAGDWVGKEGRLADAGMASAKLAVEMILTNE